MGNCKSQSSPNFCCGDNNNSHMLSSMEESQFQEIDQMCQMRSSNQKVNGIVLSLQNQLKKQQQKNSKIINQNAKFKKQTKQPPKKHKTEGYIYQGQWSGNKPFGYGKIIFANGEFFQGRIQNGILNGQGLYIMIEGSSYKGQFRNNKPHGYGIYKSNSLTFEGQWLQSIPIQGRFNFQDDKVIDLQSRNSGTIKYPDGNIYKGRINDDFLPDGYGEMKFKNKNSYQGNWKKGTLQGQGTFIWQDGSKYEGQYQKSKKHGKGKYTYQTINSKTRIHDGFWKNGVQCGLGKIVQSQIILCEGIFVNGVLDPNCNSNMSIIQERKKIPQKIVLNTQIEDEEKTEKNFLKILK